MSLELWNKANLQLISKSLAELLYEEILKADTENEFVVVHLQSGISYKFSGHLGAWDFYQIDESTLQRIPELPNLTAAQFFLDAQVDLGMSQVTLTHFMEEMNNTLFSEMIILENQSSIATSELAKLSGNEIQAFLSGHPKILLNKGRLGFSANDLEKYAPEYQNDFKVFWLAIKKELLLQTSPFSFENTVLTTNEYAELISEFNLNMNEYQLVPVHPWQFNRFIRSQYQADLVSNNIIPLKKTGQLFTPQISIRTLTGKNYDLKLSLTILNTSAYRGLSPETLKLGPELSDYMQDICEKDEYLKSTRTNVLKEAYASSMSHSIFSQIKDAPYRYNELLGCVLRESAESKIAENERAIMTGSLFYQGPDGETLIGEYTKLSGLSPETWIRKYFCHVIIPLYHLQLKYGIGIVSHGQNITLVLKDFAPAGMFIKDFQGDLRVSDKIIDKLPGNLKQLKTLPSEYLIHDLITGHFITVLRFISPLLEKTKLMSEDNFYKILSNEISNYLKQYHPDLPLTNPLNLLRAEFEKVILNKVRFQIGYEDSACRPLPLLGSNLKNPLAQRTTP